MEPYAPTLGNKRQQNFPRQFNADLHPLSLSVTPIEFYGLDGNLIIGTHATGSFYRFDDKIFLVSARHALTGLDAFSDKAIASSGFLPRKIKVYPALRSTQNTFRTSIDLDVRNDEDQPLWVQDPQFGDLRTDICCIEATSIPRAVMCVNDLEEIDLMQQVGFDCFVIGYPSPKFHQPYLPVWRRSSFAYEPSMPVDDKPIFLVDGLTSIGMSGAPIYQVWFGPAPVRKAGSDKPDIKLERITSHKFVGIYGGRLSHQAEMGQIAYGWYANRIPMMLNSSQF